MTDLEKMIIGVLIVAGLFLVALPMAIIIEAKRKGDAQREAWLNEKLRDHHRKKDAAQKPLTTPPASESPKKVDWEPDNYKDLSDGKYERFSDDDIDDAREHLTTHQRKRIGG